MQANSNIPQSEVIRSNVSPLDIAEEFIIREVIKLFPREDEKFFDKVRYNIRRYREIYNEDRFWRLLAGLSEAYMFKSLFRMLRGEKFTWNLEKLSLDNLKVKMLSDKAKEYLEKHDFNVKTAGAAMRKLSREEREKIIDPFSFSRDNYPIIAHEEDDMIIVHDGNRRALNAAIYEAGTIDAYVGRLKAGDCLKPAIYPGIISEIIKISKDAIEDRDKVLEALKVILIAMRKAYSNGDEVVQSEIKEHFIVEGDATLKKLGKEINEAPLEKEDCT